MAFDLDPSKLATGAINYFTGGVTGTISDIANSVSSFKNEATKYGLSDDDSWFSTFADWTSSIKKWFNNLVNPTKAKAGEIADTTWGNATAMFNSVATALGFAVDDTGIKDILKKNYDDITKSGIPDIDEKDGQLATKAQIIKARKDLVDHFKIKYSKDPRYADAAKGDSARLIAAAEKAAGKISGYDFLPDDPTDEAILLNTLANREPAKGSYGAYLLQVQARGADESAPIDPLDFNIAALKQIEAELAGKAPPADVDSQLVQAVHKLRPQLRGVAFEWKYDLDGKNGLSDEEVVHALPAGVKAGDITAEVIKKSVQAI